MAGSSLNQRVSEKAYEAYDHDIQIFSFLFFYTYIYIDKKEKNGLKH